MFSSFLDWFFWLLYDVQRALEVFFCQADIYMLRIYFRVLFY